MVRFEHNLKVGYICLDLLTKRIILWFIIPFILCNHYISSGNGQGGSRTTDDRIEYEAMAPEVSFVMLKKLMAVICNSFKCTDIKFVYQFKINSRFIGRYIL